MQLVRVNDGTVDDDTFLVALDERGFDERADSHLVKRTGGDGLAIEGTGGDNKQSSGQKAREMEHDGMFGGVTYESALKLQGVIILSSIDLSSLRDQQCPSLLLFYYS